VPLCRMCVVGRRCADLLYGCPLSIVHPADGAIGTHGRRRPPGPPQGDVNLADAFGRTPLLHAAATAPAAIIPLLVAAQGASWRAGSKGQA